MALFFITEHIGIIIGYGLAFLLVSKWYWGFLFQAGTMVIAGLMFMIIPRVFFDKSVFKSEDEVGPHDISQSKQGN